MSRNRNTSGLLRGGSPGRPKGVPNKATQEIKALAQRLLKDREYRKLFRARLRDGELSPGVEAMLYHYAFGKPADTLKLDGDLPLPTIHNHFHDDPDTER
jgi:hypothetical protein